MPLTSLRAERQSSNLSSPKNHITTLSCAPRLRGWSPPLSKLARAMGTGIFCESRSPPTGRPRRLGRLENRLGGSWFAGTPGGTADKWRLGKPHLPGRRRSGDLVRLYPIDYRYREAPELSSDEPFLYMASEPLRGP